MAEMDTSAAGAWPLRGRLIEPSDRLTEGVRATQGNRHSRPPLTPRAGMMEMILEPGARAAMMSQLCGECLGVLMARGSSEP